MKARRSATKCKRNAVGKQPSISRPDIRLDGRLQAPLSARAGEKLSRRANVAANPKIGSRVRLPEPGWPRRDKPRHGSGRSTEAAGKALVTAPVPRPRQ